MSAPGKIFLHTRTKPLEITWSEVPERNCINEEYVRKDTVLELIKHSYDRAITPRVRMVLANVISKIKSL